MMKKTILFFFLTFILSICLYWLYSNFHIMANTKESLPDNSAHERNSAAIDQFKFLNDTDIQKKLTKLQYHVTRENGTERSFTGKYWDNKEKGIYVDVISGEPLFSSQAKFKSGTGWPSYNQYILSNSIENKVDDSFGWNRTEVRSRYSDSHLGHVFDDGPSPTGLRYCINSASLLFIPKEDLSSMGYGIYNWIFNSSTERKDTDINFSVEGMNEITLTELKKLFQNINVNYTIKQESNKKKEISFKIDLLKNSYHEILDHLGRFLSKSKQNDEVDIKFNDLNKNNAYYRGAIYNFLRIYQSILNKNKITILSELINK